jgi:ribosomal-protein-alanine N-acetyltransferase
MHEVEAERVLLRPVASDDVDRLHAMWTDPEVRRFLWDDKVIDRALATAVVGESTELWQRKGYGLWIIVEKSSGDDAGFVGFRDSAEGDVPELVFGLLPGAWGRGLATEAARAAVTFIRDVHGHRVIRAETDAPNSRSVGVLERLGMKRESGGEAILEFTLAD